MRDCSRCPTRVEVVSVVVAGVVVWARSGVDLDCTRGSVLVVAVVLGEGRCTTEGCRRSGGRVYTDDDGATFTAAGDGDLTAVSGGAGGG